MLGMNVTLSPRSAPGRPQAQRACSRRLRDVEDKIAESVAAEPFSLLADPAFSDHNDHPRPARSALVLAGIGGRMTADEQRGFLRANGWVLHEGATAVAGQEMWNDPRDAAKPINATKTWYRTEAAVKTCARRLGAST